MNVHVNNDNGIVLILSKSSDISTDHVEAWMEYFGTNFVRINEDDKIINIHIKSISNNLTIELEYDDYCIDFSKVEKFWYRRGDFNFADDCKYEVLGALQDYLDFNWKTVKHFLHRRLMSKFHVNSIFDESGNNKLNNLHLASELGIKIPETYCGTSIKRLTSLNFSEIISKTLNYPMTYRDKECFVSDPKTISVNELMKTDRIVPSLFQSRVQKKFEVRVFFLFNKFYSLKIYSQNNNITALDYRKFAIGYKNRYERISIPNHLKEKLIQMTSVLNIKCCSIDFIVDKNNEYVFLEINPTGQFGWVSTHGNYFLEREIANMLKL